MRIKPIIVLIFLMGAAIVSFYILLQKQGQALLTKIGAPISLTPQTTPAVLSEEELKNLWPKGKRCPQEGFSIPAKEEDIVQDGPRRFYVNVIEVLFTDDATCEDAERIASLVDGTIKGFGPTTNAYGFFVPTRTVEELEAAIQKIRSLNDPKIRAVSEAALIRPIVP